MRLRGLFDANGRLEIFTAPPATPESNRRALPKLFGLGGFNFGGLSGREFGFGEGSTGKGSNGIQLAGLLNIPVEVREM